MDWVITSNHNICPFFRFFFYFGKYITMLRKLNITIFILSELKAVLGVNKTLHFNISCGAVS